MKDEIEIPFGANDSELIEETIVIPEDCYAKIEDGKVVIRRILCEDERIKKAIKSLIIASEKNGTIDGVIKEHDALVWLEKQGSQNLANSEKTCKVEQKPSIEICPHSIKSKSYLETGYPVEQTPAWSEEDEKMVEDVVEAIDTRYAVTDYNEMVAWLKSLKDRYTWKPSDEQMASLRYAVNNMKSSACFHSPLVHLLQDLEKLTE